MKTDRVINGVLIAATQPPDGEPYVWPEGVTEIGDAAFYGWHTFNHPFAIPEWITEIGYGAFCNWHSFNQPFTIPAGVTKIGNSAFYYWRSFNQPFTIPDGVTEIGGYAFCDWDSFNQSFTIPEWVTKIGSFAFTNWCSFTQPNSRRATATSDWLRIDNWVFAGCWSGTLEQLRTRLDAGASNPKREAAWDIISKSLTKEQHETTKYKESRSSSSQVERCASNRHTRHSVQAD